MGGLRPFCVRPVRPPFALAELPGPVIIAHRGGGQIYPEESVYAYDKQLEDFATYAPNVSLILEADLQMLKYSEDLLVHHDSTFDRTTDAAGSSGGTTGVRTIGDYKAVTVDQYALTNSLIPTDQLKMVTGREFIDVYGRQVCMNFECKYDQTEPGLAALIHEYRAEDYSLVWADTVATRDFFLSHGIKVLAVGDGANYPTTTPAQLKAMGVDDVGFGYIAIGDQAAWDIAQEYVDAGINVWAGGDRRAEWKHYREHPTLHRGGYSDSPLWVTGKSPRYTTDKFAERLHLPGHIAYTYGFPGNFKDLGGGIWGWGPNPSQNGWCLWGWCSPHPKAGHGAFDLLTAQQEIKAPQYPFGIEFDLTRVAGTSADHWAALAFANDDMPVHDSRSAGSDTSGRHVLMTFINTLGNVYVIDVLDGVANHVVLGSANVGAIAVGTKHRFRLEYLSATQFKVTDLTTAVSTTVTIPANLGTNGYINVGTPTGGGGSGEWAFSTVNLV